MMLEAGADIDSTWNGQGVLHFAAWNCDYEMAKHLIELGMDKKAKDSDGKTPLKIAKEEECKDWVDNWKQFKKLLIG